MRTLLLLMCIIFISVSCTDDDDNAPIVISISGTFIHDIPGCVIDTMEEASCTESASFDSNSQVSIVYGGSDLVTVFTYRQVGSGIVVLSEAAYGFDLKFEVIDAVTLKNITDDELWIQGSL